MGRRNSLVMISTTCGRILSRTRWTTASTSAGSGDNPCAWLASAAGEFPVDATEAWAAGADSGLCTGGQFACAGRNTGSQVGPILFGNRAGRIRGALVRNSGRHICFLRDENWRSRSLGLRNWRVLEFFPQQAQPAFPTLEPAREPELPPKLAPKLPADPRILPDQSCPLHLESAHPIRELVQVLLRSVQAGR